MSGSRITDVEQSAFADKGADAERLGMKSVMQLKSCVSTIKIFEPETQLGYGRTFCAPRRSRIGVLPIGYADGLFRGLSNRMSVQTDFGPAKVRGRICMDMCMIDLTDLPEVREGDEVEVYGIHNSVADAAKIAGTVAYELLCTVSRRVPRVYYRDGKAVFHELLLRG